MAENKFENINRSRKQIIFNNFLGGLAWGIGVTFGLGLFIAFVVFIARNIDFVPLVGDFVSNIINYILQNSQQNPRFSL